MAKKEKNNQLSFSLSKKAPVKIEMKRIGNIRSKPAAGPVNYYYAKKSLYEPGSKIPFGISRSKVEMFLKCPRCFYLDQRLGIKTPSMPSFSLNSAVDHLLKKEFDIRRAGGQSHPLMDAYGIDAVPVRHKDMDTWRNNFKGIRCAHPATNFELFGAIDDLWINKKGEFHVVDYKATSTAHAISLDDQWKQWYKKQAEFYQWLFRQKGYVVSDTAYFVFCNAIKDREAFDGKLEFEVTIMPYLGNDAWIEPAIMSIKECLESNKPPESGAGCEYCHYVNQAKKAN